MIEILKNVLNEDVLTSELQTEIENRFNEAVEEKSRQLVEERIQEEKQNLIEEYDAKLEDLNEMLIAKLDKFLSEEISNFKDSINERLKHDLDIEQADAIIEAFDAMVIASGADLMSIQSKFEEKTSSKEKELTEKLDSTIAKNLELKTKVQDLEKEVTLSEACKDLTISEAEKLRKVASLYPVDEDFAEKVKVLKESILEKVEETPKEEKKEEIKESWAKYC
jgi:possible prohead core scaffold protein